MATCPCGYIRSKRGMLILTSLKPPSTCLSSMWRTVVQSMCLVMYIRSCGANRKRLPWSIALVICTHSDPDHSGGVVKLAQQCGAESGMPYAMSSRLGRFENLPLSMMMRVLTSAREGLRPRAWRMYANPARSRRARRLPTHVPALNGDLTQQAPAQYRLKHGQRLPGFEDWQVVHTPGHSWDSCCYFHLPTRALISGDTLLGSTARGKLVRPAIYSSARQTERSIARLKKLNPRAVYPGHGSVVEGEELLEHL